MGLGDMANTAKEKAGEHPDQVDKGVEKGSDAAKDKIGHEEQVDKAADKGKDFLGGPDDGPAPEN